MSWVGLAYKYHGTGRFIDDLCATNDGNEFFKSFKNNYRKELELKKGHPGARSTLLDFDFTIKYNIFIHKLFDKRDFSYSKYHTCVATYSVLYFIGSLYSKLLRIARCIF